ncbi:hypothetical protein CF326_g1826 [Tilletia indica]|nr:hypothetical protein CF326_g1826 [Tilletia indica]
MGDELENSSTTRAAELVRAEVAAILAAAPTIGAAPTTTNSSGGGGGEASTSRQDAGNAVGSSIHGQGGHNNNEDIEMADAAQELEQQEQGDGPATAASTTVEIANSSAAIGTGRFPSPVPSDSDDDLSVLSSLETHSDIDSEQYNNSPRRSAWPQQNGRAEDDDRSSNGDSGSSDISEPADTGAQRGSGAFNPENDDDEGGGAGGGRREAATRSPQSSAASDDEGSSSDDNAEDDPRDASASATAVAAAAAAAAVNVMSSARSADQPTSTTVASDSSDLGSPESIADTEPLPFEDSQAQASEAALIDDDEEEEDEEEEEEEEDEEGRRAQEDASTPTAASLAEAVKDDREEVTTGSPQEAMETLTRIEIQFAMLRDRLYVERMEEVCRETEMVLEGTHPELIRFTRAIDQVRERRLRLLDLELERQVNHYEQVAEGEEHVIWNSYRYQAADLRQNMMDEAARKRRRLEREKRLIDVPRPARRHQTFETELVPNPNLQYSAALRARRREIAIADASAAVAAAGPSHPESARRAAAVVQHLQEGAAEEDASDYVAYPEVKGLDENELWSDLDRMGGYPPNWAMGAFEPAR